MNGWIVGTPTLQNTLLCPFRVRWETCGGTGHVRRDLGSCFSRETLQQWVLWSMFLLLGIEISIHTPIWRRKRADVNFARAVRIGGSRVGHATTSGRARSSGASNLEGGFLWIQHESLRMRWYPIFLTISCSTSGITKLIAGWITLGQA